MLSKFLLRVSLVAWSLWMITACGPVALPDDDDDAADDDSLRFFSPVADGGLVVADELVFLDSNIKRLLRFGVEPLILKASLPLVDDERQAAFAAADGAYYVTVSTKNYAIVKADGSTTKYPVKLSDDLEAAAFSAAHGAFAVMDEAGEAALLQLADDGAVADDFVGAPNLGERDALVAATFLNDGNLIAALGENTLAVVDFAATLAADVWRYASFSLAGNDGFAAPTAMTWLAAVPDFDDLVLVKDGERLILVDVATQAIVDEVDLAGKAKILASRDRLPHVLAADDLAGGASQNVPFQIYHVGADGMIATGVIASANAGFDRSFLSTDAETLSIIVKDERDDDDDEDQDEGSSARNRSYRANFMRGTVYRYDLEGGVRLDKTEFKDKVQVGLGAEYLLLHFDSPLGLLKRRAYGEESSHGKLQGFNLDVLRKRRS